jgi:hypothetical protein
VADRCSIAFLRLNVISIFLLKPRKTVVFSPPSEFAMLTVPASILTYASGTARGIRSMRDWH